VYQAQGEADNARKMIRKAEQYAQSHNQTYVISLAAALRTQLRIAQGNVIATARWVQERGLSADDELSYLREFEHITLARVLTAKGQAEEALRLLDRLLEAAQAMQRMGSVIKILTLKALTFQTQNDLDQALSALEQALFLAEPEGYVRTFIDEDESMARLLRHALSQGIAPNYVARLLAAFGQKAELISATMESLVEPLSEREFEVLRLVVAGLSNPEIAEEMVIAVSTVKSHINHIYGKLGVENRIQAVVRVRELGLL
jgi:LuxR family maltose regulon positive regulatory protein